MELAPLEYRTTRGRMALYALGSLLFVVVGVAMMRDPKGEWWVPFCGGLSIAFFGLCLVFSIREMVSPRLGLRLDAKGIHSRQALGGNGFDLPWTELAGVRVVTMNRQPMVVFDAHDAQWGMAGVSKAVRRMRAANALLVGSWMVVAPRMFGAKADGMVAEVNRYYRHYTPGLPVEYPR